MEDILDEAPPRDSLVRATQPFTLIRTNGDEGMPTLHGVGAVYDEWTEINSRFEGHFMERFAPGSFAKTIRDGRDRIRCLFHHGQDPNIGVKPLGTITNLGESGRGVEYDVELFDADYVRALVPGLEAGVYGSSFRFGIIKKDDVRGARARNEKGLLERTIREASMRELGPTPFPAYAGTTAGLRSITDEFVLGRFPADSLVEAAQRSQEPDLVAEMIALAHRYVVSDDADVDAMRSIIDLLDQFTGTTDALSDEAAPTGTSQPKAAKTTSNGLYGLNRGKEETPAWRL